MKLLLGNTGLVGQTIQKFEEFDQFFNSGNLEIINDIKKNGDELFLTCLPATKWMVNKNLKQDINNINTILENLTGTHYSKVTLISTIDVYNDSPLFVDETYSPNISKLSYGNNRYFFELMVKEYIKTDDLKIFRLPALFNNLIKKNVLYDLIHNNNVNKINENSFFQWYNLDKLWYDIQKLSKEYPNETIFNLFTEPIHTSEIVGMFPQHINKVQNGPLIRYNYLTKFGGYTDKKNNVLKDIKKFIDEIGSK
jgi:hypothetical protein